MAIDIKEALEILRTGNWLALRFITADVAKGTGGQILEFPRCRIAKRENLIKREHVFADPDFSKNPRHNFHFTLNMELPNGLIRKVHPILILSVNNQPVL